MKKRRIWIAIFFLIGFGILFWGVNFLKGVDLFNQQTIVYSVYPRVDGLEIGAPVDVNGLRIGQVKDIRFADNDPDRILVEMMLKTDLVIPNTAVAKIYSSDLLGSKAIGFQYKGIGEALQNLDTLPSAVETSLMEEVNRQVAPIKIKAENLLASLDTMVIAVQSIFNDSARKNLEASFRNIKQSVDYLKNTSYNIDTLVVAQRDRLAQIVGNVEAITRNIDAHEEQISHVITNFASFSDSLAALELTETIKRTDNALNQFSEMIERLDRGEGTVGQLMKNDSLYNNLERSAGELNSLLYDIKHHPERYVRVSVFGRRPSKTPYQEPEK
jgi:phospholipid/cholesterol/gamma-HCH transport system substrate-binding protein